MDRIDFGLLDLANTDTWTALLSFLSFLARHRISKISLVALEPSLSPMLTATTLLSGKSHLACTPIPTGRMLITTFLPLLSYIEYPSRSDADDAIRTLSAQDLKGHPVTVEDAVSHHWYLFLHTSTDSVQNSPREPEIDLSLLVTTTAATTDVEMTVVTTVVEDTKTVVVVTEITVMTGGEMITVPRGGGVLVPGGRGLLPGREGRGVLSPERDPDLLCLRALVKIGNLSSKT